MAGDAIWGSEEATSPASGEARIVAGLSSIASSDWRASLLLVALCLTLFLPGFFQIPAIDRDESRFVQTSRQMLESGDYVDLRFQDETRYRKPIGIYWLHSAAAHLSGYGADAPVWVYRIVSLLGATIAVLLTFQTGKRLMSAEAALVGAMLLAACGVLAVEARTAKTDAVLLAAIVAAQFALSQLYMKGARAHNEAREKLLGWPLLFWMAIGTGILIKGPIAPMISALTIATLTIADRRVGWLGRLRPLPGLVLATAIVLPWLIAINRVSGGRFLQEALGSDMLSKVAQGMESHGAPPGVHLLLLWLMFWPGAALLAVSVPAIWHSRKEPATRFCLAWIIPAFLVFELAATKLPHYTMPTYPAFALLAGVALMGGGVPADRRWARIVMMLSGVLGILIALGITATLIILEGAWQPLAILSGLGAVAVAAMTIRSAAVGLFKKTAVLFIAQAAFVYFTVFGVVVPHLHSAWLTPRIAAAMRSAAQCDQPEVMSSGYSEPSLIFEFGADIQLGAGALAAEFLAGGGCRVAVVTDPELVSFWKRANARGYNPHFVESFSGYNIGNSKWLTLHIAVPER